MTESPTITASTAVVYAVNGMTKEIKGTFVVNYMSHDAEVIYRFYDENDNLLYTSPVLTESTAKTNFNFAVGNILQIKMVSLVRSENNFARASTEIENFRLISTNY